MESKKIRFSPRETGRLSSIERGSTALGVDPDAEEAADLVPLLATGRDQRLPVVARKPHPAEVPPYVDTANALAIVNRYFFPETTEGLAGWPG